MAPKDVADLEMDAVPFRKISLAWLGNKLNRVVPRLTLILLQILIALSVFRFVESSLAPNGWAIGSDVIIAIFGTLIALGCAFLIMAKFQSIIKDFNYQSDKIEKHIQDRTEELLKFNREMQDEIRERKRIEGALAESEARFRTIIQESPLGITLMDMDGRLLEWNLAFQAILGYSFEELENADFTSFTYPEETPFAQKSLRDLLRGRGSTMRGENRYLGK